jgi:hypothetical protein
MIDTRGLMCQIADYNRWWRSHRNHAGILLPAPHVMHRGSCVLLLALTPGRTRLLDAQCCCHHSCKACQRRSQHQHRSRGQQVLQLPPTSTTRQVVPCLLVQCQTSESHQHCASSACEMYCVTPDDAGQEL